MLWIALPRAHDLELEHPRLQMVGQHAVLELFHLGQTVAIDFVEPPQVAGERVRFAVDRVPAYIFEQVVMGVNAVERGMRGMRLVEIAEEIVDEMR